MMDTCRCFRQCRACDDVYRWSRQVKGRSNSRDPSALGAQVWIVVALMRKAPSERGEFGGCINDSHVGSCLG